MLGFMVMTSIIGRVGRYFSGGRWRGRCRRPGLGSIKKQPPAPHGTRDWNAPAIPPKLTLARPLASRAITRARWITGGVPSASTGVAPFKPPSKVHSHGRAPPRSHHPGLSEGLPAGYSPFSQVCAYRIAVLHYTHPLPRLSTPKFRRPFSRPLITFCVGFKLPLNSFGEYVQNMSAFELADMFLILLNHLFQDYTCYIVFVDCQE